MASSGLIGNLIELLNAQTVIYTEMLGLSLAKKDIIIKNDIESLRVITGKENSLLGRSQRLEKSRMELMKDIAYVLNEKPANLTLDFLAGTLQGRTEAEELSEAARALREVLNKLKGANGLNKALIQNSMEYIDFSINVIRSTVGGEPMFTSPYGEGFNTNTGFFDAKQ